MIGNAVINDETDQMGMVEYAWSHAIISDELYSAVTKDCNSFKEEDDDGQNSSSVRACSPAVKAFMQAYSDIDIYSIYTPVCLSSLEERRSRKSKLVAAPRLFSQHELWHGMRWGLASGYDPCTADYVEKYFNREDVQRALHANITHLTYPYTPCRYLCFVSTKITFFYSEFKLYKTLLNYKSDKAL
ncbi:serine carboxypeptidase-like 35 [Asparagus officinalis]|nr:serine carboxypeptidase-like 35 [Asparagus officinalis]